ncbi:MAG: hypothetical protein Q4B82_08450 [Alysiella sp.]|uniref:hypothetical protein n=1 Tax=Alysiella sp. TaxID=1872483 RepID=UPI0026DB7ADA|nr:hypothetical protein [Alysiella sp.]MDO4434592.1 hypothetical protein [Alysiella sp.]
MNQLEQDPILAALARIEDKADQTLANQSQMQAEIAQIHKDCQKTARTHGAVAGGIAGGLVSATVMYIRAKLGV